MVKSSVLLGAAVEGGGGGGGGGPSAIVLGEPEELWAGDIACGNR